MGSDTKTFGGIPDRRLDDGWLGDRFHAVDPASRREVVLEFVDPAIARDRGFRERFAQEALVQQQLSHPNLVRVWNADVESETLVLVTEYVDGVPLDTILASRGPLPIDEAIRILDPVMAAVGYVHSRGVLHRGIEPANVLVLADGTVKVRNCGMARLAESSVRKRAETGPGSVHYRAPELLLDRKDAGPQADIYSLGCTLFHVVTGHAPFEEDAGGAGEPDSGVRVAHFQKPPPDPARLRPDLPGPIRDAVIAALAKNPAVRPQTCEQMSALLRARPGSKSVQPSEAPASPVPAPAPASPPSRPVAVEQPPFLPEARQETARVAPPRPEATRPVPATPAAVPAAPPRESSRSGPSGGHASPSPPGAHTRKTTPAPEKGGPSLLGVAIGVAILVILILAVLLVWAWMAKRPAPEEPALAEPSPAEVVEPSAPPPGCLADPDCPPGHSCLGRQCVARPAPAPSPPAPAPTPAPRDEAPRLPPPPPVADPGPAREPTGAALPAPAPTATHEVSGTAANATEPWLNLRRGPGGGHPVVAELPDGTRLRSRGTSGPWMEVEVVSGPHAGDRGYVHSRWLRPVRK